MAVKWEDLLAGGAGAVDELLFGIPEFVAKKIDRQAVEGWIKKNEPAYRTGETVGTVGSMFVPIPGLGAIGKAGKVAAGATKAAKAADVGTDVLRLAKAADVSTDIARGVSGAAKAAKGADFLGDIGRFAKRGAAEGALEAGVRGFTSEKEAPDILQDIKTGALFGAGGGVAGGLIGKGLKRAGKRAGDIAGEASKLSDKAIIGMTPLKGRDTNRLLKEVSGPGAKGLGKFAKRDFTREALADIIREEKLYKIGADDRYFSKVAQNWDNIGKAFEQAYPDARGSQILGEALQRATKDLEGIAKMPGGQVAMESLQKIMAEGSNLQGLNNLKSYLQGIVEDTFKPGALDSNAAKAQRALAQSLKRNIDEMSMDAAQKLGLDIDFTKRKKNYVFDRVLADAIAREDVAPLRVNTGSPTMEKLGMGLAGATVGGVTGLGGDEPLEDRLKKAAGQAALYGAAGLGGSMLKGATSKAAGSAIARSKPLAELFEKAAPRIGQIAEKLPAELGAQVGGRAGAAISRQAAEAAEPSTPAQAEAAQAGAEAGTEQPGTPAYYGRVLDGLARYAASKGVSTESPEYSQFVQMVYQATGGFKPEAIGGILYQDPEERAAYTKALGVAKQLKEIAPTAISKGPGFLQKEEAETGIQRQAAVDQLSALVGDVAKATGTEKAAKAELSKILKRNVPAEQKEQLIRTLLAAYGVDVDELYSMGVV
jgi:hypothetical protein